MSAKKLYIKTLGCQMNVYDSEIMERILAPLGYIPAASSEEADVIIVNTCAIRAKAEQKVYSYLGRMARLKKEKPWVILCVAGCVAQAQGKKVIERMPHCDLVFGTHAVGRLAHNILRVTNEHVRIVDVDFSDKILEVKAAPLAPGKEEMPRSSAFVTIMTGCDNYCTYCVVPYVRGREMSRQPEDICNEVRQLVSSGVKEVTLLGQNVNSYGIKEGIESFSALLARVNAIEGLARIRFTTSHPKDISSDLMQAFGSLPKLMPHIHLPVQSGSDQILKRMNRGYTRSDYLQKIHGLREICPQIAITTDIIVGFPGETEADFAATADLVRTVGYNGIFVFNYSDRQLAPASHFSGKVEEKEKTRRLTTILEISKSQIMAAHNAMENTVQTVLIEGFSKQDKNELFGRTPGNTIVNFPAPENCPADKIALLWGHRIDVEIKKAHAHSLWGLPVLRHDPDTLTKEVCHAA